MGTTIEGRYQVTGLIGEGGMGTVYRAQHTRIGRMVAIKCLREEYARDQRAVQGFFNEAMTAATLHHPNIVEATDMGELPSGVPYLVLELLDGRSLHDELDYTGRLSVRRALRIAQQIAAGVSAAHEAGIIHRDLKSDNVFLIDRGTNPDFVKIFDFGVAHVLGKLGTDTDHVVGTPEFMPPEQITDPTRVDTRADVYAVGVILYHMLSGKKPYGDLSLPVPELLAHIVTSPPAPLAGVPEDVRLLVEDAMARDRDRRVQSLADLAERMKVIVPHTQSSPSLKVAQVAPVVLPPVAVAPAPSVSIAPPPRSHRLAVGLAAGGVAAAAVGVFFAWHGASHGAETPAPAAAPPQVVAMAPAPAATPPAPPPLPATRTVGPPEPVAEETTMPPDAGASPTHPESRQAPHVPVSTRPRTIDKAPSPIGAPPTPAATKAPPDPRGPKPDAHVDSKPDPRPVETAPVKPPPAPLPPTTTSAQPKPGTIDVTATRAAVRPHLAAVQRCFERAKMDDLSLTGSLSVRITIAPDGSISKAEVAKSTLGAPSAERCIVQEVGTWRLPPPSGGVSASLVYPFVFE